MLSHLASVHPLAGDNPARLDGVGLLVAHNCLRVCRTPHPAIKVRQFLANDRSDQIMCQGLSGVLIQVDSRKALDRALGALCAAPLDWGLPGLL